jgi:hypothetical protein
MAASPGRGQLSLLAAAYARLPPPASAPAGEGAAALVTLCGLRLAAKAAAMLADDDDDDLFFESGRAYVELLEALVRSWRAHALALCLCSRRGRPAMHAGVRGRAAPMSWRVTHADT